MTDTTIPTEDHLVVVVCGRDDGFGLHCQTCGVRKILGQSPPSIARVNVAARALTHRPAFTQTSREPADA